MATIKASDGQSIFDLAVQLYGTVEATFRVISENPSILENVNDNPPASSDVVYTVEKNNRIATYFREGFITVNASDPIINSGNAFDLGFDNGFN